MNKIRYLHYFLILSVLTAGLFGCSSDNRTTATSTKRAWSIGRQYLIKNDGTRMDLKAADESRATLALGDKIIFPDVSTLDQKPQQLVIHTTCVQSSHKPLEHTYTELMQNEYEVFELLPMEVLQNSYADHKNPYACSIEFTARNQTGDTHRIVLRQTVIELTSASRPIRLKKLFEEQLPNPNEIYVQVYTDELASLSLPPLNKERESYRIQCNSGLTATAARQAVAINLNEMDWSNPVSSISPVDRCRIFQLQNEKRILGISDEFVLRTEVDGPVVTMLETFSMIEPLYTIIAPATPLKAELASFVLSNPTDQNMIIEVPPESLSLNLTVIYSPQRGLSIGSPLTVQMRLEVKNVDVKNINGHLRFLIPAGKNVTLALQRFGAKGFACGPHTGLGALYQFASPNGFYVHQLDSMDAQEGDMLRVLNVMTLSAPLERYWYTPLTHKVQVGHMTGRQYDPPPKEAPTPQRIVENQCRAI